MAQRRMFSHRIINSAKFIKMPHSARLLYYDLGMNADDDGVVEAYSVLMATNSNEDDLKILASKDFIRVLNEDLVAYILDWNEHNQLRADRKIDSIYKELLIQIIPDVKLLRAKKRADTLKKTTRRTGEITGRPLDVKWTAKGRLGKVSLVKTTNEVEEKLLKFLKEQDKITSPDGYLNWIKGQVKPEDLKKLLTIEFSEWPMYIKSWS
jgi:hypothetical protein